MPEDWTRNKRKAKPNKKTHGDSKRNGAETGSYPPPLSLDQNIPGFVAWSDLEYHNTPYSVPSLPYSVQYLCLQSTHEREQTSPNPPRSSSFLSVGDFPAHAPSTSCSREMTDWVRSAKRIFQWALKVWDDYCNSLSRVWRLFLARADDWWY